MDSPNRKHSYTIPCCSDFRDAILDLAERRKVNVADLARSVALVVVPEHIAAYPDPGEPAADDRETVILKSGSAKGRPWRRKPRIQVRMSKGHEITMIRRALGVALAMDRGELSVVLDGLDTVSVPASRNSASEGNVPADTSDPNIIREAREELERLRAMVSVLSFEPLSGGVTTRNDAKHILGFPPDSNPDLSTLRNRFRMLATIHHPDNPHGNHQRMSQLNAAMDMLRRGAA